MSSYHNDQPVTGSKASPDRLNRENFAAHLAEKDSGTGHEESAEEGFGSGGGLVGLQRRQLSSV